MQVSEYLKTGNSNNEPVEITGHLVLVENRLILIDSSEINNFKAAKGICIDEQALKYVLRDMLLPLGGESSIFHKAKLVGVVRSDEVLSIRVQKMQVQERGNINFLDVDIEAKHIENCRLKYEPVEGFDFFKEMGD